MLEILFENEDFVKTEVEKVLFADGDLINVDKIIVGHTIFIDDDGNKIPVQEDSYKLLIKSTIRTEHNTYFFDIIKYKAHGIVGGFSGFACIPNKGICVDSFLPLSKLIDDKELTIEELKIFIEEYNANQNINKKL